MKKYVIPVAGGYICPRCGKFYSDFYKANGHLGRCSGLQGDPHQIAQNLANQENPDKNLLFGLLLLGLFVLGIFGEKKKK